MISLSGAMLSILASVMARFPDLAAARTTELPIFKLLPNKTVYENVAFAMEVIGRPRHVVRTQVPQVLDLVGLAKKAGRFPSELSGGEQQRVSIARAFVNQIGRASCRERVYVLV